MKRRQTHTRAHARNTYIANRTDTECWQTYTGKQEDRQEDRHVGNAVSGAVLNDEIIVI